MSNDNHNNDENGENGENDIRPSDKHNFNDIDQLPPEALAEYLYDLAEKIIEDPLAYKVEFGLTEIDIQQLDNINLSTAEGRKKLAKLFRLLAKQAFKGKEVYLETVQGQSQQTGRGR